MLAVADGVCDGDGYWAVCGDDWQVVLAVEKGLLGGVRWVLFDAVGTLIDAEPPVAEVYFAAARDFGSSQSIAEIQARFSAALVTEQGADATKLERLPTSEAQEQERW